MNATVLVDPFGVVQVAAQSYEGLDAELQVRALRRLLIGRGSGDCRALGPVEALAGRLRDEPEVTATLGGAAVSRRGGLIRVWREAGRLRWAAQPVEAGGQLLFDGRFLIAADRQPVMVSVGTGLTRDAVERFTGARLALPMASLAAVPQVRDGAGVAGARAVICAPGLRVTRCRPDW